MHNIHPQLDLFSHVAAAYGISGKLENAVLYKAVAAAAKISEDELEVKVPIGRSGQKHNILARKIRWQQQTLKRLNLIQRVQEGKGLWELTEKGKKELSKAKPSVQMLAFSTDLGLAIWGQCRNVFDQLDVPIMAAICSPPYPLSTTHQRAYGNPNQNDYVDFICHSLEPIIRNLADGGSIALNISNDVFLTGSPARSLYVERLIIALCDRFGLELADRLVWNNPSKAPGPIQWASLNRMHLNTGYEPIYILTNNALKMRSNNQRVLQPHSERHLKLMAQGGEKRVQSYSDGAYTIREKSFSNVTEGKIPKNVLTYGHSCADQRRYKREAAALGLPVHGAPFPLSLIDFLVRFLTEVNDLVVDPFGGSCTTGVAAENAGRRWVVSECMWEYLRGGATRFQSANGYRLNPQFSSILH